MCSWLQWPIRMSHWCCRATEGAEFWISCKRPAFHSNFSCLQLIQNSAPSVARQCQCDIRIVQKYSSFYRYKILWKIVEILSRLNFIKLHAAVENSTTLVKLLHTTIPLLKLIWSYKFGIANYYANFLCRLWRGKEAIQNWRHPGQAASKSNVRIMIFLVIDYQYRYLNK